MTDDLLRWLEDGQQALENGRYADARDAFTRVHKQRPADVSIAIALANVHRLSGDLSQVQRVLLRAHAEGDWSAPSTAFSLGSALLDAGAALEAAACFQRVVKAMPNDAAAAGALAGARRALGEANVAWPLIERAARKAPSDPALLLTAAQVRHDLADFPAALRFLDRADMARPGHRPTRLQRAYTTLIQGASAEGWELFDERSLPVPLTTALDWHGEPLGLGSVLVTAEQGIGDQFQFMRFVPMLRERGAGRIVVECHADAVSLISVNGFEAIARGANIETDWHVPLLSLPHRLQLGPNVSGDRVPYLQAPSSLASHSPPASGERFDGRADRNARRIGLVWAGNPSFPGRVTRDFPSALLPSILAIPGIEWTSLQFGEAGNAAPPELRRESLPRDWAGTANLLTQLDGLVTTDTGIAHLAGAIGLPTWVLLQHVPDWRWGVRGESTPWYPTMRLVRQTKWNDWRGVVGRLSEILSA